MLLVQDYVKASFPLQSYRPETWRISLLSGTNDFDTKENATVRYDTVEVENWLNRCFDGPRKIH